MAHTQIMTNYHIKMIFSFIKENKKMKSVLSVTDIIWRREWDVGAGEERERRKRRIAILMNGDWWVVSGEFECVYATL